MEQKRQELVYAKRKASWLLAAVCEERGLRALAVDTDTQGNLTNSLLPERDGQPGIEALFHPGSDLAGEAATLSINRRDVLDATR